MKRTIGRLVVVASFAVVGFVATASPSSAARRNACLDEQHYNETLGAMTARASSSYDVWVAYEHPVITLDNSASVDVYKVSLPDGGVKIYWTEQDWSQARNAAWVSYINMDTFVALFEVQQAECSL